MAGRLWCRRYSAWEYCSTFPSTRARTPGPRMTKTATKRKPRDAREASAQSDSACRQWRGPVTDEGRRALIAAGGIGGHICPVGAVGGGRVRGGAGGLPRVGGSAPPLGSVLGLAEGLEM